MFKLTQQQQRQIARAHLIDRIASWGISLAGVLVVVAILGIFVEIASVSLRLFASAEIAPVMRTAAVDPDPIHIGIDDYAKYVYSISATGTIHFVDVGSDQVVHIDHFSNPSSRASMIVGAYSNSAETVTLLWDDASVSLVQAGSTVSFDADSQRSIMPRAILVETFPAPSTSWSIVAGIARHEPEDNILSVIAEVASGEIIGYRRAASENFLGEQTLSIAEYTIPAATRVGSIAASQQWPATINRAGTSMYLIDDKANLQAWDLRGLVDEEQPINIGTANNVVQGHSQIRWVLGEQSLVVGDATGRVNSWHYVQGDLGQIRPIHKLHTRENAIQTIATAPDTKSVITVENNGKLVLEHITGERVVLQQSVAKLSQLAFNSRGNALVGFDGDRIYAWNVHNEHPEAGWSSLFTRIWYEGYREPAYVWQSSSASNDFEPKLSLIPLIVGTLKATFYAMLFSVPIAILAAIYASQFLSPKYHRKIKPVVEMMAAFPSVVIGFLAALWLAPVLENNILGFFMLLFNIPVGLWLWLQVWDRITTNRPGFKALTAIEYWIAVPLVFALIAGTFQLGTWLDPMLFPEGIAQWMYETLGVQYDQRNSFVIAIALGFAVIPVIFTIADDALSNVPRSLTAASLALGASRWQTVWRVVLISASPGIFAAVMIGFGRAVGETMIVLMAAGNTPILDWSAFNGMRTLAANIAVEIPEAPHGGTLYRILFLSALLLFGMTFTINTVAELVRSRLREKYGRF